MYYISKVVQHVDMQHGRLLEHCILLSLGCLGREVIASFLLLSFFNEFPSSALFELMYLYCHLFVPFAFVNKKKTAVGFYRIQRIH
jgi:hypothetical protein